MQANQTIEILNLINAIERQTTARMQRSLRDAELGLAAMEARTLRFVARHPGCTQKDIAHASGRDKAQIARIIKTLRERGYVGPLVDEAGRKRQQLALTATGTATHKKAEALRTSAARLLVEDLDPAERDQLERLLQRMSQPTSSRQG